MNRIILHSDINSFYVAVEHLNHPEYEGRPMAVGGDPKKRHGIILTADYLSRRYGVRTGMPLWEARKLCPELIIVQPRMDLYKEYSNMAHDIYAEYTDLIEPYGIDESWLDISAMVKDEKQGLLIAKEINSRMKKEIGITNSVGMSWNKVFAKLGSDYQKPDAVTVFMKEQMELIRSLPASDLLYVGKNTGNRLRSMGIYTIGHLADAPESLLTKNLGKSGTMFKRFAMGLDDDSVNPDNYSRELKSIGHSTTTSEDLLDNDDVKRVFYELAELVAYRLKKHCLKAGVLEISIRTSDMETQSRQCQLNQKTDIADEIAKSAYSLFVDNYRWHKNIRSLGIRMANLVDVNEPEQLTLFADESNRSKLKNMDRTVDSIRDRFGSDIIKRGIMFLDRDNK